LTLRELAHGNGDPANRETEYDDGDTGPQPCEKRAFICEVIASAVAVHFGFCAMATGCWL